MAAAQHELLTRAQAQLNADVMAMRQDLQAQQAATHADHAAAQSEWARFNKAMAERRAGESAEASMPTPAPEPVKAQPVMTMPEPAPETIKPFPVSTESEEEADVKKKMI